MTVVSKWKSKDLEISAGEISTAAKGELLHLSGSFKQSENELVNKERKAYFKLIEDFFSFNPNIPVSLHVFDHVDRSYGAHLEQTYLNFKTAQLTLFEFIRQVRLTLFISHLENTILGFIKSLVILPYCPGNVVRQFTLTQLETFFWQQVRECIKR